ncbi:Phage integrase family protein [Pseudobutyrivibrio sp. 49]|uniref:tyrosine-type recombinase/integrase n=1 Tax=Pseudobutyrivibrio sp. 49 TaxID=1855344 RepID=UPI00087E4E2A|nr:tyrosine-type recombinase/integrase [Pseudobutyrivibrio sp. 49]SDI51805.1 Phage integrase family protein [Pseudobutyrivibrio sp. 49]
MNKIINFEEELTKLIRTQEERKSNIVKEHKCGIITDADMHEELKMISKKEVSMKRKLVNKVHVKMNGTPKAIRYEASRDLWVTKVSGDVRLHARTEAGLLDKILEYYDYHLMSYSIDHMFELALENKEQTENCSKLTIQRLKDDYNRFISDDFGKTDIRNVTKDSLKAYTKSMVIELHPKFKAFLKYKGVLNLIFEYALEYDYIQVNPVTAINNQKYKAECDTSKPANTEKILSNEDIKMIQAEVRKRMKLPRYNGYFICGYMILLAIETGMRAAELCALKWDDIEDYNIHIHAQQLTERPAGGKVFYYADWTKDEKGVSRGGRYYPITDNIAEILIKLKCLQKGKGIDSEYVFCNTAGEWIKMNAYESCLRRLMRSMGYSVTNNHAFRMSLNSNILIPKGIPVADRARLLGHSVETNLRHYSYARIGVDEEIRNLLNA